MELRILGPIEVLSDGRPVQVGGPRQRALLAYLLLHANEVVPAERLLDRLWDDPPGLPALQTQVSRLRRLLGDRIVTSGPGYAIRVEPGELDLDVFRSLLAEAGAAVDPAERSRLLREADALWRGEPLAGLDVPFAAGEAAALQELRLGALEDRIEADLATGLAAELVSELVVLVARHPLRERLRGQQMLALYRCGRQADALDAYRDARQLLDEELGLEPGPVLRELELAILRHDPALANAPVIEPDGVERPSRSSAPWNGHSRQTLLLAGTVLAAVAAGVGVGTFALTRSSANAARASSRRVDAAARTVTLADDFSETTPNVTIWNLGGSGSGPTWALRNGRLVFTVPADATPGGTYDMVGPTWSTRCRFDGNFDERIDYRLLRWPAGGGAHVQLTAWIFPDLNSDAGRQVNQFADQYNGNIGPHFTLLDTGDRSGTLRLVRTNGVETAYYEHDGKWVAIQTGAFRGQAQLGLQLFGMANEWTHRTMQVAFDNFAVTGSHVVCP